MRMGLGGVHPPGRLLSVVRRHLTTFLVHGKKRLQWYGLSRWANRDFAAEGVLCVMSGKIKAAKVNASAEVT
jgi:hypothetical protein